MLLALVEASQVLMAGIKVKVDFFDGRCGFSFLARRRKKALLGSRLGEHNEKLVGAKRDKLLLLCDFPKPTASASLSIFQRVQSLTKVCMKRGYVTIKSVAQKHEAMMIILLG